MSGTHENVTVWDHPSQVPPEAVAERVVSLGILGAERAQAALAAYRERPGGATTSFSSFLVDQGLVGLDGVQALQQALLQGSEPVEVVPGTRVSGCVIERKLGQGGMGVVYRARREADGASVVVKFLAAEHLHNTTLRTRFVREALLVRAIEHENVVRVYSVDMEGPSPHIVMELVEGQDLEERLAAAGRLPPLEVARIGRDLASGLAAAHAHGVVHRDIKPGNVRITPDGKVKILDFGLAKSVQSDAGVSMAGQVLGTPFYMAPEQWGEHEVDERCDIYSLGATLYHLVTGRVPFPGSRVTTILSRLLDGRFPPPREVVPEVPEALELAILRMMARERRCRQATAAACAQDLDRVLRGEAVDVPRLVETATGRVHALVPGASFVVGSGPDCQVRLVDPTVAPHHATVELAPPGFVVHDHGSKAGTSVESMRVESVLLRDGDHLHLGAVEVTFSSGGVGADAQGPPQDQQLHVRGVPDPFVQALVAARDRRIVVFLIEQLAPNVAARVASSRAALRALLGGDVAERACEGLARRLSGQRAEAAHALFHLTRENLGDDLEAWLRWWDRAGALYPPQVGAHRLVSGTRLRIVHGEDGPPRTVELDVRRLVCVIGRGAECDVQLRDRSVSRRHATLVRVDRSVMVRDEGSRFGTRVNGASVSSALLSPGDRVTLARVELVFEADDWDARPPLAPDGSRLVDVAVFDALVELAHPAAARALARFTAGAGPWVERVARSLEPGDPARAGKLAVAVRELYVARARAAREVLARLLELPAPAEGAAEGRSWGAEVERRAANLPPQVAPIAWFPELQPAHEPIG